LRGANSPEAISIQILTTTPSVNAEGFFIIITKAQINFGVYAPEFFGDPVFVNREISSNLAISLLPKI
jgi:hypothetical protein